MIKDLTFEEFVSLIDNLHDEINIWDSNYNLLYINRACERHYGRAKESMIGKTYFELMGQDEWYPALLPNVYAEKIPLMKRQQTKFGGNIVSITIPILDDDGSVKYVISSVRDESSITEFTIGEKEKEILEENEDSIEDSNLIKKTIVYKSKAMKETMNLAETLCNVDSPVIILGETGVGKTFLAREMHKMSNRKNKPFIVVNCGAIPTELMESEFFGYEEGAFTGAKKDGKKGFFESADGGVLLLDEISELPLMLQTKLLHVIQEKEIMPVGSTTAKKVDVKVIAATNKDLKKLVEDGKYREDLYYRLGVFEIVIPPLRERNKDIEILAYYYVNKFNNKYGHLHTFSKETLEIFKNYHWKGNIRELSHLIERLVVTIANPEIKPYHLPGHLFESSEDIIPKSELKVKLAGSFEDRIEAYKREIIIEAYNELKSSRKIANKLDISQSKASRLIRKYVDGEN